MDVQKTIAEEYRKAMILKDALKTVLDEVPMTANEKVAFTKRYREAEKLFHKLEAKVWSQLKECQHVLGVPRSERDQESEEVESIAEKVSEVLIRSVRDSELSLSSESRSIKVNTENLIKELTTEVSPVSKSSVVNQVPFEVSLKGKVGPGVLSLSLTLSAEHQDNVSSRDHSEEPDPPKP